MFSYSIEAPDGKRYDHSNPDHQGSLQYELREPGSCRKTIMLPQGSRTAAPVRTGQSAGFCHLSGRSACGMSRFADDDSVAAVFERVDRMMYENKNMLKASAAGL